MKTFHTLSIGALALAIQLSTARADLITPVLATPSSELSTYNRQSINCINSSGLSGLGNAGDSHTTGESGVVWTTNGNIAAPNDLNPEIIFDLGSLYDITKIREWGYNDPTVNGSSGQSVSGFSPNQVDIYTSSDGTNYTFAETTNFAKAPGSNDYAGHDIAVNYPGVRYIKLDIMSNHDNATFDGTGTTPGLDGRSLTGLSEIRFEGSTPFFGNPVENPLPTAGTTEVEPNSQLSWNANDPSNDVTQYTISIGVGDISYDYLVHTTTVPRGGTATENYTPPANILQTGGSYWWRVDKVTASGTVIGPVWTLETRDETTAEQDERMAWFRHDKLFGAIVWGLYSGAEGVWPPKTGTKSPSWTYAEWMQFWAGEDTVSYRDALEPHLTGENFNAAQQARLCKDAGMTMVYVMPRHHDGYAIWDTATSTIISPDGFKIANSPYNPSKRDFLKELVDALRAEGLRVGFYFSLGDWHHPDFPHSGGPWAHPTAGTNTPFGHNEVWSNYVSYLHQQVREIVDPSTGTDYGIFDVVYFDYSSSGINGEDWGATKLVHMVREHNPNIIINNRLWNGLANTNGDYSTPEAHVENVGYDQYGDRDWEAIMSANTPATWGYGGDAYPFKSAAELVWNVVEVAAKGGTIELSVSPKGDGSLHADQLTQYAGLGSWMNTHGASIRGTTSNPVGIRPSWGEYTSKRGSNRLYMHVFDRPTDGNVIASGLSGSVNSAWLLSDVTETPLTLTPTVDGFSVFLPAGSVDPINTVIVVDYAFPSAPPASITSVVEVSSENVVGLDRDADHTVNSSGLTSTGLTLAHEQGESGVAWTTVGNLGPGTDFEPYIIYDLGSVTNISTIREWGYNSNVGLGGGNLITIIGPDKVNVYTSADGLAYTFVETVNFAQAPGSDGYEGNAITVNYTGIRYIRLDIETNHDGAIFDGTGTNGGTTDGRFLTGLSEIRFDEAPPALIMHITGIRADGLTTEVDAAGLDHGTNYLLTRSINLIDNFATIVDGPRKPPAGETMTLIDSQPPADKAFYRIEEAP